MIAISIFLALISIGILNPHHSTKPPMQGVFRPHLDSYNVNIKRAKKPEETKHYQEITIDLPSTWK